eukprot:TRINITY_DN1794_c0_g1_i9.p2 TRINITY_DN1794_c0_g1~~TRINITY_DN1794_c0_g1_i9.p2  ORF type:complete len:157 (-),score=68.84 TRINITY_DN1794_c0_g1_i9:81-551(-)
MKQMKCTACSAISGHLYDALENAFKVNHDRLRNPKVQMYADVFDSVCTKLDNKFGLELNSAGITTHTVSKHDAKDDTDRLRGIWVNTYIKNNCVKLMHKWEDHIVTKGADFHQNKDRFQSTVCTVSYTHLRAHETPEHLVCRLLLEKKKKKNRKLQ